MTVPKKRATPVSVTRVAPRVKSSFHRDWMSMLVPIFITVGISVIAQLGTSIWQGAMFKAQVQQIDAHQKDQDSAIQTNSKAIVENQKSLTMVVTRLPIDYEPRVELDRENLSKQRQEEENSQRMTRMEAQLNQILQNQIEHGRK